MTTHSRPGIYISPECLKSGMLPNEIICVSGATNDDVTIISGEDAGWDFTVQ